MLFLPGLVTTSI